MKTDADLQNSFRVSLLQDDLIKVEILNNETAVDDNVRLAELIEKAEQDIFNKDSQKHYNMLVSTLPIGKQGHMSSKSKKIYARMAAHDQADKVAFVNKGDIVLRVVVNFIMGAVGKKTNLKMFDTEAAALEWLKK